jgi:hypothetical protein
MHRQANNFSTGETASGPGMSSYSARPPHGLRRNPLLQCVSRPAGHARLTGPSPAAASVFTRSPRRAPPAPTMGFNHVSSRTNPIARLSRGFHPRAAPRRLRWSTSPSSTGTPTMRVRWPKVPTRSTSRRSKPISDCALLRSAVSTALRTCGQRSGGDGLAPTARLPCSYLHLDRPRRAPT